LAGAKRIPSNPYRLEAVAIAQWHAGVSCEKLKYRLYVADKLRANAICNPAGISLSKAE
jgi:hypothetical protein